MRNNEIARTFLILALACIGGTRMASGQVLLPPLHLTVVLHNEEPGGGRPDYTADRNFYLQNRQLVKLLAETITSKGATFNFQSDWNYLKAAAMFDTGSVTSNTAGKNIVRWMHENRGIEIDPHAHETQYNYADVTYLIEQLGVTPFPDMSRKEDSVGQHSHRWLKSGRRNITANRFDTTVGQQRHHIRLSGKKCG